MATKKHFLVKNFYLFLVFFLTMVCPMNGQTIKNKVVEESDYHLWGYLKQDQLSNYGKWASFHMSYESNKDTLFIKSIDTHKLFAIPNGYNSKFSLDENWVAFQSYDGYVGLLNLRNGKREHFEDATIYDWSNSGHYLSLYFQVEKKLIIRDIRSGFSKTFSGITDHHFNHKGNILAYIQEMDGMNKVVKINLENNFSEHPIYRSPDKIQNLKLHETKESLIFLEEYSHPDYIEKSHVIHFYNNKLNSYDPRLEKDFPKDKYVSRNLIISVSDFFISKQEHRIFFPIQKWTRVSDTFASRNEDQVEIWHYKDTEVFPRQENFNFSVIGAKLAAWDLKDNKIDEITNSSQGLYVLNESHTHALIYSDSEYLPLFKHQGLYSDVYIFDLEKHQKSLFLDKLNLENPILSSPKGRYFNYFRDNNWWIYDLDSQKHFAITKAIKEKITKDFSLTSRETIPLSFPVWSRDENEIFISGVNNIWRMNLINSTTAQLTNGFKHGYSYEIYNGPRASQNARAIHHNKVSIIENPKEIIVKKTSLQSKFSGFEILNENSQNETLVYGDILTDELFSSKNNKTMVFRQQRYDQSPQLKLYKDGELSDLYQSNTHEHKFYWGSSKLIQYKDSKNKPLQGILYYPSDYDSEKQYPLIVIPYDQQTRYYNQFILPSMAADGELLTSVLNLKGYFVLLPDINYEEGNAGISASNCIVSATKKAMELENINPNGIGIMGHSFGAYETYFTITQTNLFSAAIAGSGFSDLFTFSLSIHPGFRNHPETNYFEFGQIRMNKPFYEMKDLYLKNSPIFQSDKINTPLLSWSGKNDSRVFWNQSLYMYLALRRMEKENIMLIYPNEYHVLTKKENQLDLTSKVLDWFDYHLKGHEPKDWITNTNQY
ncbi:alpha/beta hydrolase family protein [Subsaximicrobium wynnwilliamsii]|nr:prolyl oligopeptidase family serine peptidase [Subsaximicrobium wynnwilliamsii]